MTKQDLITAVQLREMLNYDPLTGIFTWKMRKDVRPQWNGRYDGTVAGWLDWKGYVIITIHYIDYRAHRLAWLWMTGEWPADEVDHEDTDVSNNRWENLRPATHSQNSANQGIRSNNTSGRKGVSWDRFRKKWMAVCRVNGKYVLKKRFDKFEDACAAYDDAAISAFGEYARLE
jgi:hypothetical protein